MPEDVKKQTRIKPLWIGPLRHLYVDFHGSIFKERFCFYHFKHFGPPNMPFSDCSQCWLLLALQVETALAVCSESVWILFLHLFLPVLLGFFLPNIDINKCNRSSAGQGVLLALNIFFSLWKRAVQRIGLGDNHLNAAGKNVKR